MLVEAYPPATLVEVVVMVVVVQGKRHVGRGDKWEAYPPATLAEVRGRGREF